ncbi:hypothetical protein Tco_0848446 [Tanacetum coccineum]
MELAKNENIVTQSEARGTRRLGFCYIEQDSHSVYTHRNAVLLQDQNIEPPVRSFLPAVPSLRITRPFRNLSGFPTDISQVQELVVEDETSSDLGNLNLQQHGCL